MFGIRNLVSSVALTCAMFVQASSATALRHDLKEWHSVMDALEFLTYERPADMIEATIDKAFSTVGDLSLEAYAAHEWEQIRHLLDSAGRTTKVTSHNDSQRSLRRALAAYFLLWKIDPDPDARRLRELSDIWSRRFISTDGALLHHLVGAHLALHDRRETEFRDHLQSLFFDVILEIERRSEGEERDRNKARLVAENIAALYLIDAGLDARWSTALDHSVAIPFLLRGRVSYYKDDLAIFLSRMEGPNTDGPNTGFAFPFLIAEQIEFPETVDLSNPEDRRLIAEVEKLLSQAYDASRMLKGRLEAISQLLYKMRLALVSAPSEQRPEHVIALAGRVANILTGPTADVIREAIGAGKTGGSLDDTGFSRRQDLISRTHDLIRWAHKTSEATVATYFDLAMKSTDGGQRGRLLTVAENVLLVQLATVRLGLVTGYPLPAHEWAFSGRRAELLGDVLWARLDASPSPSLLARCANAYTLASILNPLLGHSIHRVFEIGTTRGGADYPNNLRSIASRMKKASVLDRDLGASPDLVAFIYERLANGRGIGDTKGVEEQAQALLDAILGDPNARAHTALERSGRTVSHGDLERLLEVLVDQSEPV